ncbi:hypothetical protein TrCOL_g3143 [Triparma columacea]|uniref:VOC domain-containing protein n=1 Tax=Triparma columacea TaxID=722753 RepID=A0A9W7LCJ3_9STRA|nr:hypothetical protein TrCOL_g3143 [Triparma columacea]
MLSRIPPKISRNVLTSLFKASSLPCRATPFSSIQASGLSTAADDRQQRPFHYAFPVHDLDAAKDFYGNTLGCSEGRSSTKWQDYNLYGHQIVCHFAGSNYRCLDWYNPVDGDEVPVPHAGIVLTHSQFHALVERIKGQVDFIIEPHRRFEGQPGEQWTMFFKDPSGNNLEFKAMEHEGNLFTKYEVKEG